VTPRSPIPDDDLTEGGPRSRYRKTFQVLFLLLSDIEGVRWGPPGIDVPGVDLSDGGPTPGESEESFRYFFRFFLRDKELGGDPRYSVACFKELGKRTF
jgi:hypothetical protein